MSKLEYLTAWLSSNLSLNDYIKKYNNNTNDKICNKDLFIFRNQVKIMINSKYGNSISISETNNECINKEFIYKFQEINNYLKSF